MAEMHLKSVALSAMSSFVEWMEFEVMLRDCRLLEVLCSLLEDEGLKTPACECLLHILSRKVGDVDCPILK